MSHVSYSELRANLASYLDDVCDSRAPLVVTRRNARNVVMIAQDEYEALLETMHLLRSPANAERLLRSIAQADAWAGRERALIEPDEAAGGP